MIEIVEADAASAPARQLLEEYLDLRAATFPGPRAYLRNPADPAQFVRPGGAFLLATEGGQPVGCGGVRLLDPARAEIKHLYVRAAAQRHGIGRLLLEHLESTARELGAREVVLDTNSSLAAAAAVYRRRGYEPIPAYNTNPNADVWLGKSLEGAP